jgi:superfamily II DNA or RNA helicase
MIVEIKTFDLMKIQIVTEDSDYMSLMREEFTRYVEGFMYMRQYQSGSWNGKTCMIHRFNNSIPYGLLFDFIRVHKKNFPRNRLIIDQKVKSLFRGPQLTPKYDLNLKPYPYQKDCIEASLNYTKGIIRSATASGKSAIITYIIKTLLENPTISKVTKAIIIVPTKHLVEQFYGDMIDYGVPERNIGRVYQKYKHWDRPIVVATWQTVSRNIDEITKCDVIIIDETHQSKSYELRKILSKATRAHYRFGFTGTLHSSDLDNWNVKAYLGPVIREYPSGFLADEGYISKCNVKMLNMEYQQNEWEGTYNDVRDEIFRNEYRMKIIRKIVKSVDHNMLILVGKVEKEGEYIEEILKNCGKEVVFLSGRDDVDTREEWREKCASRKDIVIIATYGIFQLGVNIPNLKYIMMAAPFKSKIRVLQSIGRGLRKHTDKEEGAVIFDIHDHAKHFGKYGDIRIRYYDSEGFDVKEFVFTEGDEASVSPLM